jgi:arginine/lysine/ornithine decarboxylase
LAVEEAIGKICGAPTVSCPPAVPVVISGEVITEQDAELMRKYGIETIDVVSL